METDWMFILYVVLLIDSMIAVFMSWFGQKWWIHAIGPLSKHFPPAKGWAILYFVLVLVIGHLAGFY